MEMGMGMGVFSSVVSRVPSFSCHDTQYSHDSAGILQIFVHPEYERQGYGAKVMVKVREAMDERRAHGFALASQDAVAFYLRLGFRPAVSFRIIHGSFSGGLVGMVRKPFKRQIPRALPDTGPSQQPQAPEEAAPESSNTPSTGVSFAVNHTEELMRIESEVHTIALRISDKVRGARFGGDAFSNSEVREIIKICIRTLNPNDPVERLRAQWDGVVDEAIKHFTAMKVMKTIKRLEGRSEAELGGAEVSQADITGRGREVVRVNIEELKRIFARARAREGGANGE
jgi:hypothetical protein